MKNFTINTNPYLDYDIEAYYFGTHENWRSTEVGFLNTLKNDDGTFTNAKREFGFTLDEAKNKVKEILNRDLTEINKNYNQKLTVCIVPRSKPSAMYNDNQLKFSEAIKEFVNEHTEFYDGTNYIQRIIETPVTHLTRDYNSVTVGVTKETCSISSEVNGKDIILIDDIYTESINIIEDAIQALFDNGAKSVILYTLGKTI
jgi:phosphoribosylpyrophosphate synthetase